MSCRPTARTLPRARQGMTLVEVVVAMLILTGVLLTLGAFSARFAQANGQAGLVITANEIAATRLDEVRIIPRYDLIEGLKSTTARPADSIRMANTVFTRTTNVLRVGGGAAQDSLDYRVVTVTVRHPAMRKVVSKSTAVAAF